jgi:hypothetical protein
VNSMANQEHLDRLLKQGVQAWNNWREDNLPDYREDLPRWGEKSVQIDLRGASLGGTNLYRVNLYQADLSYADLSEADLREAFLDEANLREAKLNKADLRSATLTKTNLREAKLNEADLREAFLNEADLTDVDLRDANFWEACMGWGFLGNVDLSVAKGLEAVRHEGPSTIGIDTIYRSQGNIPELFLKGAGIDDTFITYIRSLVGKAIEYYSCFISYSSKDDAFARRLYTDLQSKNVRCWFAPEDLKIGDKIRTGIDEAIRIHDKLLLILSKSSVSSGWVEREVKTALAKERRDKRTVLFPVRVDNAVFESPFEWATEIRHERNIGDFTRWKNHDDYEKAFTRLLRDLKAEAYKQNWVLVVLPPTTGTGGPRYKL